MAAILSMHSHATAPAMLTAFDDQTQDLRWRTVNDNVMGGRSRGGFDVDDGVLIFAGSTITIVPPGFRTRRASERPLRLSYQSLKEKREQTPSKVESSKGRDSASPLTKDASESPLSLLFEFTRGSAAAIIEGMGSRQTKSRPSTISAKDPGPLPISNIT